MGKIFYLVVLLLFYSAQVSALKFSVEHPQNLGKISSGDNDALCDVAKNTERYLNLYADDHFAVHAGKIITDNLTVDRVKTTLAFICKINQEDRQTNQPSRLNNTDYLSQHFDFYRWTPDKAYADSIATKSTNANKIRMLNNIPTKKILLTKYYTKLLNGSSVQTQKYNQALYALPFDEKNLTLKQAEQNKSQLNRYKYTRQQIISGLLVKNNLAKPLIWLSEEALHDVLLQGTGVLNVDGKVRYFNVHRNNGIAYDYTMGKREQPRYWYFIETPEIMGYGYNQQSKIAIKPQVTFAGNVADLGLGKLIMVSYPIKNSDTKNSKGFKTISRLGVLADQGGAFDNNLFQLDLLVDSYRGWTDYHQANKHLPDYTRAWILLLKE
jgi:hypothetical protein